MTPQDIIENNILLARFCDFITEDGEGNIKENPNSFKFHNDWNWLMKIVQNINLIYNYNYTVQINSMDVKIHSDKHKKLVIDYFSPYGVDELIKGLYEACIQFVKWYNQNKGGN